MIPDSEKSPDDLLVILNTVACASTAVWALAPCGKDRITLCSAQFLSIFDIQDCSQEIRAAGIPLNDQRLAPGLRQYGLTPATFRLLLHQQGGKPDSTGSVPTNRAWLQNYECSTVFRQSGEAIATLIVLQELRRDLISDQLLQRASDSLLRLRKLSPRESQVLELIFDGQTNKAAARVIEISEKTVEKHRANVMRKLNVTNTADLIKKVTEARLIYSCDLGNPNSAADVAADND
ncbi:MAG: hypothetical protein KDA81_03290 [Planctomycetaceae bacterium]|nr:hypothetical protein [Planctomycetaceae bacterium]